MITPEKAFEIAKSYSWDMLAPRAYDAEKYWLFEYGGNEDVDDPWPIIVDKKTGIPKELYDDEENEEIWDKIDTFPAIELNLEIPKMPAKNS